MSLHRLNLIISAGSTIRRRSGGPLSLQALFPTTSVHSHGPLGKSAPSSASSFRCRVSSLSTFSSPSRGSVSLSSSFGHNFLSFMSSRKSSFTTTVPEDMSFLSQEDATKIDKELFDEYGFTLEQLMELAGLAVATAVAKAYPITEGQTGSGAKSSLSTGKVLICAGPGNNGGDGLVAARHLKWFGYEPCIFYPKQPSKPLFATLRRQCEEMEIPFMSFLPEAALVDQNFSLVIDALFGFGFKPPVRPEFVEVLQKLCKIKTPIVSVDIPSGWDVEMGPHADSINPAMIISLTAPKKGLKNYKGIHFLGGRFVPTSLAAKHNLRLPPYPGTELVVQLQ